MAKREPNQAQNDVNKAIDQAQKAVDKALGDTSADVPSTDTTSDSASETPAKDLSSLPTWNCRVDGSPRDQQWTVGETFGLICQGPSAEFLSTELKFKEKTTENGDGKTKAKESTGYELKVLEVTKQSSNELEMVATSYIPKPHQFQNLYLEDQGEPILKVEPFTLQVKSVITDPQQKPYGPMGPVSLSYPVWIWIGLVAVLVAGAFFVLFRMNRRAQMRRVIEELKLHNTALGSFNQFNKDLRTLGRQHIFGDENSWPAGKKQRYIENLDEIFRMYLLREFYVPALEWSSGLTVKTISKQDKRRFPRYGGDLQKFLKEMDRAKMDAEKVRVHDCQQLTQMAKRVTQSIWRVRKV